ncbi:AAA family ATPase [Candidatus Pelagibacter sp.]|nr:AAA family ATPase [Candidatus Pelagibacter sp.]
MLTKLSLKNIKSYNEESTVDLAPITFIYGPNSSGKSTLWKFLITLKDSLRRGYGASFLNFNRSDDFANARTISFDPKESSNFSLSFFGGRKIYYDNWGKWSNKDKEKIKFQFDFFNTETIDGFSDRFSDTINDLKKLIENNEEIAGDQRDVLKKNIELLLNSNKPIKETQNILSKKFKNKDDKGVILAHINIYKEGKCFAKYAVHQLDNVSAVDMNRMIGRDVRLGKSFPNKDQRSQLKKKLETEILNILKNSFGDKFRFEAKVPVELSLWNEDFDGEFEENKSVIFDFIGPNGPGDIKIRSFNNPVGSGNSNINYLFVPIEVSEDNFFWKEHYDFLQYIKKIIINNPHNKGKSRKEIFRQYINEKLNQNHSYHENVHKIDSRKIPEVISTWENIQKIMEASLEEFIKIMSNDFRTWILRGSSFIPGNNFYGGEIYQTIFDSLPSRFIDSYITEEKLSSEGKEFIEKYEKFCVHSYDDQLTSLANFSNRDLASVRENRFNQNLYRPRINSVGALFSTLHDDPDFKKSVVERLAKLELPFEIKTSTDDKGNMVFGFSNKNISKSQRDIPLQQSGNALQSILGTVVDLMRSDNETIIIEEPENKIHPKIQGNLIEAIIEICEKNNNRVIIETHSEHFILRIQKLLRDKKIHQDSIAINYVYLDEDGKGSKIDNMKLDENGKFINKWRHGFFSERLNEI